jgi:hypothetical protein
MIYFAQDTVTQAIKIGYSGKPIKRVAGLRSATPTDLTLLGTIPGGLEHERGLHEMFANYRLNGEWFKPDILPRAKEINGKEAANPQQPRVNVIVSGDNRRFAATRQTLEALVFQALNEIRARTPIAWVIIGGERPLDHCAW